MEGDIPWIGPYFEQGEAMRDNKRSQSVCIHRDYAQDTDTLAAEGNDHIGQWLERGID
jgi:hypothetical protein